MANKKSEQREPRDSYVFYRGWYEAIKLYPPEKQSELYNMINEYALNAIEPQADSIEIKAMYNMVKPLLDSNYKRWTAGKKGGRPSKDKADGSKHTIDKPDQPGEGFYDPVLEEERKKKQSALERLTGS